MKRTIPAAALISAAVVALAGCGGSSSGGGGGGNTPSPTSTAALPDLGGQSIEVAAEWQKDEEKSFKQVLGAFEDATGATIKYTSTGDQTATILGTRVAGGNPPDVALIPQPGLIQQFVDKGAVKPLPDDVSTAVTQNFGQAWQDLGTFNGKLYAVWFKAANKSTMWYRPDAFAQAGVTPPTSWSDFIKSLGTLRDSGSTPLSIGGGDGWTLTDWFENVYLSSAGPDMYDKLTQHKIKWTDPSVKTALQALQQAWTSKYIAPNALQTLFPDSVTQVFGQKKAAQVYEGDFVAGVISGSTKAKVGTDAKFYPFPQAGSTSGVVGGGDAAVMFKDTPATEALMTYLASAQSADIWVKLGGFTSPNKNVPSADYPDDISRQIADQLVNAESFKFDMSDQEPSQFGGTPNQGEWKDLQDFLGGKSVAATQQALEKDAAAAYKS
jgi:ABC-type glycerol-3-phosphate transport system substrate-binding protein